MDRLRTRMGKGCWFGLVLVAALTTIAGCSSPEPSTDVGQSTDEFEGDLVFQNITLNRSDEQGRLLWEVTAAEARYSRDRKFAQLQKPKGKLYEAGKLLYEVQAERGEVEANGEVLRLRGKIRATDVRDRVKFEGKEAAWRPQQALFDVTKGMKVSRDDVVLTAGAGKASNRERRIELLGKTRTVSKKQGADFKADRLVWLLKDDRVDALGSVDGSFKKLPVASASPGASPSPQASGQGKANEYATIKADRMTWLRKESTLYASGKVQSAGTGADGATARVTSDKATWRRKDDVVDARGSVRAAGVEPDGTPLAMASDRMVWRRKEDWLDALGNVQAAGVSGDGSPVQLSGDRVIWQRKEKILQATGNVEAISQEPTLRTKTERLVWQLGAKLVQSDTRTVVEVLDCQGGTCRVQQRAVGNRADLDLKQQTAFLRGNAQVSLTDPAVDVLGESLAWQMKAQVLTADQPVTAIDREQQVVLRGDRGTFNGKAKVVDLVGNVRGTDGKRGAELRSGRLIWAIEQQVLQALGRAFYRQNDPPLTSQGEQLFAQLKDGAMSLYGGPSGQARSTFMTETQSGGTSERSGNGAAGSSPGGSPGGAPGPAGPAVPMPDSNPLPPIPPSLLSARAEEVLLPPPIAGER